MLLFSVNAKEAISVQTILLPAQRQYGAALYS